MAFAGHMLLLPVVQGTLAIAVTGIIATRLLILAFSAVVFHFSYLLSFQPR